MICMSDCRGSCLGWWQGRDLQGIKDGNGQVTECLRVRGAQCEDGIVPVFPSLLRDVGAVQEGNLRGRSALRCGRMEVIVGRPTDTCDD